MEMVALENVGFSYPGRAEKALDGISLGVKRGEFLLLCGVSGCGKTTLMRLLKSALAPHGRRTGRILYGGEDLDALPERRAAGEIGFVMQNPEAQIVTDKVWHELAFGLENLGLESQKIRLRVGEMANFFGIQEWFHKNTAELSGGQKQMLNLAAIMVMQPKLLLLDEPTSQLDPIAAADFIATVQKLNRDLGTTVILAEHRLEEVFPIVDRVAVLEGGRLLACAPPREIAGRPGVFLGSRSIAAGLPSAVRIYHALDNEGLLAEKADCPLTVREGRDFLEELCGEAPAVPSATALLAAPGDAPPSREDTVLAAKNLWFRYDKDLPDVLAGVKLSLARGEVLSILGGNGSGKTTLLSVLAGQRQAYRGKVLVEGKKTSAYKAGQLYKNRLALLPQNPQLLFLKDSLIEDYREVGLVMGYTEAETLAETRRILDFLGIGPLLKSHPYDLSGGEQQRAAIGKLLMLKPRLMLLDEPTKGLDAGFKLQLRQLLADMQAEGISALLVTHDVEFAAEASDRCGLFFDGQVLSLGAPGDFFAGNSFFTTAANRIARQLDPAAVTVEDVVALCRRAALPEQEARYGA